MWLMKSFPTFCQLFTWRGFEMQLLSLSSVKHVMYMNRINPWVYFVSLLNSSVTRSLWIIGKTYSVKFAANLFSFSSLNQSSSFSSKMVSSRVGMLHKVHNFDGPMWKTHRVIILSLVMSLNIWFWIKHPILLSYIVPKLS